MSNVKSSLRQTDAGPWTLDFRQHEQMTLDKDTVELRAGEELNLPALDDYLRQHLAASDFDPTASLELKQFPGGHSNLTYLIRYGKDEFVMRRPPLGPVRSEERRVGKECRWSWETGVYRQNSVSR